MNSMEFLSKLFALIAVRWTRYHWKLLKINKNVEKPNTGEQNDKTIKLTHLERISGDTSAIAFFMSAWIE